MNNKKEEGMAFDGMAGTGVNRAGNKYAGNYSGLVAKEHYGAGPTKGGALSQPTGAGKPATRDAYRTAPATAAQGGRITGGATVKCPANSDKINVGR